MISGGEKHVLKAPVDGSTRKPFVLISKLAHCLTGRKVLLAGPGKAPDGGLVGQNPLILNRSHEVSRHDNVRVSLHRCKRCYNSHEGEQRPQFLAWTMSSYALR